MHLICGESYFTNSIQRGSKAGVPDITLTSLYEIIICLGWRNRERTVLYELFDGNSCGHYLEKVLSMHHVWVYGS
jgi:hypothetical protein